MAGWYGAYPNLFQIVGDSIPELLARIPGMGNEQRFSEVREALRITSLVYKTQMSNNSVRIPWSNPIYQCAYVFLYFVKHSNLVYEALYSNSHHFEPVWRQLRDIQVCSIGGGPGSDIAGVIAFLEGTTFGVALRCSVLDLYPQWENAWNAIARNLVSRLNPVYVSYHRFNLVETASFTWDNLQRISNANLVTFVKSFSTVSREQSVYFQVLPHIMNAVKPGGFVLFIDNSAADVQNEIFKQIAQDCGLRVLHETVSDTTLALCSSTNMENYSRVFDYKPMRSCSVTVYLMQKPLLCPMTLLGSNLTSSNSGLHQIPQNFHAQSSSINRVPTSPNAPFNTAPSSQNAMANMGPDFKDASFHLMPAAASQSTPINMAPGSHSTIPTETSATSRSIHGNYIRSHPSDSQLEEPVKCSRNDEILSEEELGMIFETTNEEEFGLDRSRSSSSLSSSTSGSSSSSGCDSTTVEDNPYHLPDWENFGIAIIVVFVVLVIFF